jgi:guanine nucleotide-binding protein subunit alpha
MNMLHNRRFTDEERCDFKECIFSNTIVSMKVILGAMDQLGIDLEDESLEEFAEVIMDAPDDYDQNFLETTISNALIKLWSDPGVKSCFSRSREYQLNDSAG